MKNVCFLNGHLILRIHKTGVHFFHEMITKEICKLKKGYTMKIAFFDRKAQHIDLMKKDKYTWMKHISVIYKPFPRILGYFLPIEFFFGKNDLYFCDGFFPHCIRNSKRVCMVHDLMVKIYPHNYSLIKKIYLETFFRKLKKADLIFCPSDSTKRDIIRFYRIPEKNIKVCYCGMPDMSLGIQDHLDDISINIERKYLFYIGDMRKNKNLENTIQAFLMYCKENNATDLWFYIAGNKNGEYNSLKKLCESDEYGDRVVFLGYLSENDKNLLYQNCAAVMLVSKYEGFGIPILEGMRFKKPVIAGNCSSMKEIGQNAVELVNPYDSESIVKAIVKVVSPNYQINIQEYERKLQKYSFENVAKIINTEIENIL